MIQNIPGISILPLGGAREICQVCIIVKDLAKSTKKYADLFGVPVPPIRTLSEDAKSLVTYRGKPLTGGFTQTVFYFRPDYGFELICPDEGPSVWRECMDRFGEGVNHIAYDIHDMDATIMEMGKLGYPVIQRGEFEKRNGSYAYLDTYDDLKVYVELLHHRERAPFGADLFGKGIV